MPNLPKLNDSGTRSTHSVTRFPTGEGALGRSPYVIGDRPTGAHLPDHSGKTRQLELPIVEGVASKLEAILQRCDKVKRGSSLFDAKGEAAANLIAAAAVPPPRNVKQDKPGKIGRVLREKAFL
jgi:hypothetical protein